MLDKERPFAEGQVDLRQELHDTGVEINALLPEETGFSVASVDGTDESGVTHMLVSTSSNQEFEYRVEQEYTPDSIKYLKRLRWHRALQEDTGMQVVEEFQDGHLLFIRRGFEEADIAEIRRSVEFIKSKNGQA